MCIKRWLKHYPQEVPSVRISEDNLAKLLLHDCRHISEAYRQYIFWAKP